MCGLGWRYPVAPIAAAVLFGGPGLLAASSFAAEYQFAAVVQSFPGRLTPGSINSQGLVAFAAFRDDGTSGIYISRGGPMVAIAEDLLNDNSPFEPGPSDPAFGELPMINAGGRVAFQGRTNQGVGVYVGSGAAPVRIAPAGGFLLYH